MIIHHNNILRSLLSIFMLFLFTTSTHAHPGKTDGNGGHTNSNTGEYHYHHGYEAHFHIGGQCPFDFDDRTGQSSGNPSNSGSSGPSSNWETTSKDVRPETKPPLTKPQSSTNDSVANKPQTKSEVNVGSIVAGVLCISAIIFVFFGIPLINARSYASRPSNYTEGRNASRTNYRSNNITSHPKSASDSHANSTSTEKEVHNISQRILPSIARDNYDNYWELKHQYERRLCLYGSSAYRVLGMENNIITFKKEPENTYDRKAIAVYRKQERIGYIYRGQMQDMMNEWLNKKNILIGFICSVQTCPQIVTIGIAFYAPIQSPKLINHNKGDDLCLRSPP